MFEMNSVEKKLSDISSVEENIYLSIDMDVLNSGEFDSVSYPLIGGISIGNLIYWIDTILDTKKVYFTDINEYNPLMGRDNSEIFFQFVKRIINKLEKIKNE